MFFYRYKSITQQDFNRFQVICTDLWYARNNVQKNVIWLYLPGSHVPEGPTNLRASQTKGLKRLSERGLRVGYFSDDMRSCVVLLSTIDSFLPVADVMKQLFSSEKMLLKKVHLHS